MGYEYLEYYGLEAKRPMSAPISSEMHALDRSGEAKAGGFFANLKIGRKLALAFGFLVILTLLGGLVSYQGSRQASVNIDRTGDVRVPAALTASRAQANLLRMQADVRGYLALGEKQYRDGYAESAQAFEADLAELQRLSQESGAIDTARLAQINQEYPAWSAYPERLFALRDDQLDREPAYQTLVITGTLHAGQVLIDIKSLIELQKVREPSNNNQQLLGDMAKFQGNFASMLSALRGYTTTRNWIYQSEYSVNKTDNDNSWDTLVNKRLQMTPAQQDLLDNIAKNREAFLALPEPIFNILASPGWRLDLQMFSSEALPIAKNMQDLLSELVTDQEHLLAADLATGRRNLQLANRLILAAGAVALIVGLGAAYLSQKVIADPISKLTGVADQIRSGDLEAQAPVESKDEIGVLASTFNSMTAKLRQTLRQVRKEKKRADDLLEVVIPIGVELTTEKDFNRLLVKMLLEAQGFCRADTGALYLRPSQAEHLEFAIVRSNSRQVALGGTTGQTIPFAPLPLHLGEPGEAGQPHLVVRVAREGNALKIPDAREIPSSQVFNVDACDVLADYTFHSILALPLKNSDGQVLGVLQLINARDADTDTYVAFDQNLQQMMESFSSLAVAALDAYIREQALRKEINKLRIEIDEVKRQKQVEEIVGTDFFQSITSKAEELRQRRRQQGLKPSSE